MPDLSMFSGSPGLLALGVVLFAVPILVYMTKPKARGLPTAPCSVMKGIEIMSGQDCVGILHQYAKDLGPMYVLPLPSLTPYVVLTDSQLAKKVLKDSSNDKTHHFDILNQCTFSVPNMFTKRTHGKGPVHGWDWVRKGVAHSFTSSTFNDHRRQEKVDEFCQVIDKRFVATGEAMDVNAWMTRLTLDNIGVVAFDFDFGAMRDPDDPENLGNKYLRDIRVQFEEYGSVQLVQPWRKYMPWLEDVRQANKCTEEMYGICQHILDEYRRKHGLTGKDEEAMTAKKGKSVIEDLIHLPYVSDRHRCADIHVFIGAGYETTAFSMGWFLWEMAKDVEFQAKLAAELHAAPEDKKSKLPLLGHAIKEAMRLWPVAATGVWRQLSKDVSSEDGSITLRKGCDIACMFYPMFRAPWIDNPDKFDPSRWEEGAKQVHELKEMIIPFSMGRRACVGQTHASLQMHVVLARLIEEYEWTLCEDATPTYNFTFRPAGLKLFVKKREFSS